VFDEQAHSAGEQEADLAVRMKIKTKRNNLRQNLRI
jgi:hypothetical protein